MAKRVSTTTDSGTGRIGGQVAAYRRLRALKVSELARLAGVTPSLISQIERGQSRPSVATLFSLAEVLAVPVDALFASQPAEAAATPREPRPAARTSPRRYVVRRRDRTVLDIEGGVRWERLTPASLDAVEFLELVYEPGSESSAALYQHPGTELVLVLSGSFEIHLGFDVHRLEPGDSIWFPSSLPHRYVNPGDTVARGVTVILPDAPSSTL